MTLPQFTILLDQNGSTKLYAASFYGKGKYAVSDSIQAVQDAGLLQVPPHLINKSAFLTSKGISKKRPIHYSSLAEKLEVNIPANRYKEIHGGSYVINIIGAGFFMSRPEIMRSQIKNNRLRNRGQYDNPGFALTETDIDLLLGENQAWQFNGQKITTVHIPLFTSFHEFMEKSKSTLPSFMQAYAVMRPISPSKDLYDIRMADITDKWINKGGWKDEIKFLVPENGLPPCYSELMYDVQPNNSGGGAITKNFLTTMLETTYFDNVNSTHSLGIKPEDLELFIKTLTAPNQSKRASLQRIITPPLISTPRLYTTNTSTADNGYALLPNLDYSNE